MTKSWTKYDYGINKLKRRVKILSEFFLSTLIFQEISEFSRFSLISWLFQIFPIFKVFPECWETWTPNFEDSISK